VGQVTPHISGMLQSTNNPRLVTRGESYECHEVVGDDGEAYIVVIQNNRPKLIHIPKPKIDGVATSAIVDYLNCSFQFDKNTDLAHFFKELFSVIGAAFTPAVSRNSGIYGYSHSFKLGDSSALFAYGGNANTGFLSFSGEACHQIPNWKQLVDYLKNILNARITRWDGAHDDFDGTHSVDMALQLYSKGQFTRGGRKPLMDQRGNWVEPDGRGRTLYVGSGKNGKLIRVYEKGMQLGIPYHPWVRWETQLGSRDRKIPWDAVLEPGKYLAGTCPAMAWISKEQTRIRILKKQAKLGYASLNYWASLSYGKHINAMLKKEGSAEKVVEILKRSGLPKRIDLPELPGFGKVLP